MESSAALTSDSTLEGVAGAGAEAAAAGEEEMRPRRPSSFARASWSSATRRFAIFLPTPGTVATRAASEAATIPANADGVNVESTDRARDGPTPEIVIRRSKRARSSREAKPYMVIAVSRTERRVSRVTPASPAAGSDAVVMDEQRSR